MYRKFRDFIFQDYLVVGAVSSPGFRSVAGFLCELWLLEPHDCVGIVAFWFFWCLRKKCELLTGQKLGAKSTERGYKPEWTVFDQSCSCNSAFSMLVIGDMMAFPPLQAKWLSHPLHHMPGQSDLIFLGMKKKKAPTPVFFCCIPGSRTSAQSSWTSRICPLSPREQDT